MSSNLNKIKELMENCKKNPNDQHQYNNLLIEIGKCLIESNDHIKEISNPEIDNLKRKGYVTAKEFEEKYDFCDKGELSKLNRFCKDFIHWTKVGSLHFYHGEEVIKYMAKYPDRFPRLYGRLVKKKFFGLLKDGQFE